MGVNVALNYGPVHTAGLYSYDLVERRREQHRLYNHSPKGRERYRRWRASETAKWGGLTDRRFSTAWLRKDMATIEETKVMSI